jgi:large subunit ribosomal protein L30
MAKKKIKVILKRSPIGETQRERATVRGLGLGKINSFSLLKDTPSVRGMIEKVKHLVEVEGLSE